MTAVPYQATIRTGAKAYSKPDGIGWGNAPVGAVVTVGSEWLGYGRVDNPKWDNGKSYWVELHYLAAYTPPVVDPDPTEPTTPAGALPVNLPDGSQLVNRDPIVWVKGAG